MKITKKEKVETAWNLAFNLEQFKDAVVLMGEWIKEETAKDYSSDFPTEYHAEIMIDIHYVLERYIEKEMEKELLIMKYTVRQIIIELDAFMVQLEIIDSLVKAIVDPIKGEDDASTD